MEESRVRELPFFFVNFFFNFSDIVTHDCIVKIKITSIQSTVFTSTLEPGSMERVKHRELSFF